SVYVASAKAREVGIAMKTVATLHGLQADFLADFAAYGECIDAIICTNELARRLVAAQAAEPHRALYAPYGVEESETKIREASAAKPLRIAYVGRIENGQKRTDDVVDILIAATRSELDIEIYVAGGGADEPAMRRRAMEGGVANRLYFLGVLNSDELKRLIYARCDALIITSLWETGPIVAWEAMNYDLAVITSAYIGSVAEGALRDGENCLMFPVGDIDAAVAKIQLLTSPDERARLLRNGRELVRSRYTKSKSIAQWDATLTAVRDMPLKPRSSMPAVPRNGRLDAWFGPVGGEAIRKFFGRRHHHVEPGAEWPHAYGVGALREEAFWRLAKQLDRQATK
ncbi:MAG: glycosyltransferase family 4 protein, partial [Methylocystis sp.]|nr:glycosyltransferase family 4 protein [Methylocystis sp.]